MGWRRDVFQVPCWPSGPRYAPLGCVGWWCFFCSYEVLLSLSVVEIFEFFLVEFGVLKLGARPLLQQEVEMRGCIARPCRTLVATLIGRPATNRRRPALTHGRGVVNAETIGFLGRSLGGAFSNTARVRVDTHRFPLLACLLSVAYVKFRSV